MALTAELECKSISRWFPSEVIFEIIQAAPRSDQAALCKTSKLFNALGVLVLYRVVKITNHASLDGFCSTILSNSSKFPELVRSFTVACSEPKNEFLFTRKRLQEIATRLSNCCKTLLHIESLLLLRFHGSDPQHQLLSGTFPSLVHWKIPAIWPEMAPITSFLVRHPALKSLWIETSLLDVSRPSTSNLIPMSNLQRLRSPARLLSCITDTQLTEVKLSFERPEPLEAIFATLNPLTRTDMPFVCSICSWHHVYEEIVDSLSTHLPHTRTLQIEIMQVDLNLPSDMFSSIPNLLPRFTALAFLLLCNYTFSPFVFYGDEPEAQIRLFADACPTLQACGFDQRAWRKVDSVWENFSIQDFLVLAGIRSWV
ncbi:hypothetical protein C8R45DRAFT_607981 [Mycena sanguinolenta]|nr:hypothetical protein C8R45DRAFT_607981 [Mycena sanguinolenta]